MDYFSAAEAMQEIIRMKQCGKKNGNFFNIIDQIMVHRVVDTNKRN